MVAHDRTCADPGHRHVRCQGGNSPECGQRQTCRPTAAFPGRGSTGLRVSNWTRFSTEIETGQSWRCVPALCLQYPVIDANANGLTVLATLATYNSGLWPKPEFEWQTQPRFQLSVPIQAETTIALNPTTTIVPLRSTLPIAIRRGILASDLPSALPSAQGRM